MAVVSSTKKYTASAKLNAGTTTTGAQKYKSVIIGTLNPTSATPEKIMNVADLLAPCLDSAMLSVESTEVKVLTRES